MGHPAHCGCCRVNHNPSTSINACSQELVCFNWKSRVWSGCVQFAEASVLHCGHIALRLQDHAMQLQCTAATSCPTHTAHARTLAQRQLGYNGVIFFSLDSWSTPPCWASCLGAWTARPRWSACSCWPGRSGTGRRPHPPPSAGTDWSGPPCRAAARPWAAGGWGVQRHLL